MMEKSECTPDGCALGFLVAETVPGIPLACPTLLRQRPLAALGALSAPECAWGSGGSSREQWEWQLPQHKPPGRQGLENSRTDHP